MGADAQVAPAPVPAQDAGGAATADAGLAATASVAARHRRRLSGGLPHDRGMKIFFTEPEFIRLREGAEQARVRLGSFVAELAIAAISDVSPVRRSWQQRQLLETRLALLACVSELRSPSGPSSGPTRPSAPDPGPRPGPLAAPEPPAAPGAAVGAAAPAGPGPGRPAEGAARALHTERPTGAPIFPAGSSGPLAIERALAALDAATHLLADRLLCLW